MGKIYTALGLMSGTSMDGVDVSIIMSDGNKEYSTKLDKYFKYGDELQKKVIDLRAKISIPEHLKSHSEEIVHLEREITLFHANAVNEILDKSKIDVDILGFHGQTIFHDSKKKISKQLGDGKLLSQLTKKKVVYDFRQNDLKNGGQGAPLVPIFHNTIANKISKKFNLQFPINFLNIGGIANMTLTADERNFKYLDKIFAYDIGPGNCLIDEWIRKNSKKKYDSEGKIAQSGKTDELILNQALDNFNIHSNYEKSLDIKEFDIFFAKGLSLENGAATITEFTSKLIIDGMIFAHNQLQNASCHWLVCGGGRKNRYLLELIKTYFGKLNLDPIDKFDINGDFVESQAFAYLAIRSLLGIPISFPTTTRCKESSLGGVIVKNF